MKTMRRLCRYLERVHPGYIAELSEPESYRGWYKIYITEPMRGLTSEYYATGCREFREWIDGVVLD